MAKTSRPGDAVEWPSSRGRVEGTVGKAFTSPVVVEGRRAAASKDNSEVPVRGAKTGAPAAHVRTR